MLLSERVAGKGRGRKVENADGRGGNEGGECEKEGGERPRDDGALNNPLVEYR